MILLAATIALAPFSLDVYIPALPDMAEAFGVEVVQMNHTMSTYLIGFGLGQIFGGPISDQIGRRTIGLIGLSIYLLATLGIILSNSLDQLMVLRGIQAIGGGFTTITVMPMMRDVYPVNEIGRRYSMVFMIMMVAPLVAPVIGVALIQLNWHWVFVFLLVYASIIWACFVFVIPETRQQTSRLPNFRHIFPQYWQVITHRVNGRRIPIRYGMTVALCGCVMMVYLTNASFIIQVYYGKPDHLFPLFFGSVVLGVAVFNWMSMRKLGSMSLGRVAAYFRTGVRTQLIATSVLALAVFFDHTEIWLIFPCIVLIIAMLGITQPSGSTLYLAEFRKLSGSASALQTTTLFGLGGLIGALSSQLNDGSLSSYALASLGASLAANLVLLSIPRVDRDTPFRSEPETSS